MTDNGNPRALVTGASSGIGAMYAERLAQRGHDLVLVARDQQRMETLATRLRGQHGVDIEVLRADLMQADPLRRVEQRLHDDPAISMLVNNAGLSIGAGFTEAEPAQFDALIALNITAVTRLAAAAARAFSARGNGTIINLGSVTALMPGAFEPVYSASKAYVLSLSRSLAVQLAPKGVRVQAVLPGITRTEIWERSGRDVDSLPAHMVMEVEDMVDASLAGLDLGETVTLPSLPELADWQAVVQAETRLHPNLSLNRPAARYRRG